MTDQIAIGRESLEDVPLDMATSRKDSTVTATASDEVVAGNPEAVEVVMTRPNLEERQESGREITVDPSELPITLLPEPLHLDTHPADDLHPPDSPTTELITSLRSQLSLLSEQSHMLNTKLVASISRHADLEDQHYALQHTHKSLEEKAGELEKSKKQWEQSMNTALLVERSQIRDEMQKLAAGLVEEERRRGSAEERRWKVEGEVDALTATLFDQANTMVASERMGRVQAEERLKSTEDNLAAAEAAVRDMQLHLQSLPATANPSADSARSAHHTPNPRRYLSSHVPYGEFITFLQHLRALRPLKDRPKDFFPSPVITTLLAQPFLARAVGEDHDSALRLDAAPDLSWLTRKGVSQAIISGDLIIEPVSPSTIIAHSSSSIDSIGCSLCGKPIFASTVPQSPASSHFGPPPSHPAQRTSSTSRFSLKPFFNASSPSQALASPTQSPLASPGPAQVNPTLSTVYIFRIVATQSSDKEPRSYPICKTGWCLERLRATCDLWHFVRTGIIQVVWTGDDGYVLASEAGQATPQRASSGTLEPGPEVVRRKSGWGLGFKLADKGGSGSWTKAFNRTGSTPSSPAVEKVNEIDSAEQVVVDGTVDEGSVDVEATEKSAGAEAVTPSETKVEEGLGAPLELDGEKEAETQRENGDVPIIREPDMSPIAAVTGTVDSGPIEDDQDTLQGPGPKLRRNDSTPSINGTDDGASFSTPKGINNELPDEEDLTGGSADLKPDVVYLSSPVPQLSPRKAGKMPLLPPPIPKRAAGRNRLSQLEVNGSSSSLERLAPSPTDSEGAQSPIPTEIIAVEASVAEVVTDVSGEGDMADSTSEIEVRPSLSTRPPLPARHPKTPTTQMAEQNSEGGRTFLGGEGWEVRTWKQVIRLKEEMWRARVGITDT